MSFNSRGDDASPGIGAADVTQLWRDRLYRRLANQPTPIVLFDEDLRSAASLWAGAREWTRRLRAQAVRAGDRLVLRHDDPAVLLQLLVASLWDGLTLHIMPADVGAAGVPGLLDRHAPAVRTTLVAAAADQPQWMARLDAHVLAVPAPGGWPASIERTGAVPAAHAIEPSTDATNATTKTPVNEPVVLGPDGRACTHGQLLIESDTWAATMQLRAARVLVLGAGETTVGVSAALLAPLLYADELYVAPNAGRADALLVTEPVTHLLDAGIVASQVVTDRSRKPAILGVAVHRVEGDAPRSH